MRALPVSRNWRPISTKAADRQRLECLPPWRAASTPRVLCRGNAMERVQLSRRKLGAVAEAINPLRQHEPPPQYHDDAGMRDKALKLWCGQDDAGEDAEQ